jgi:hypothetical protein
LIPAWSGKSAYEAVASRATGVTRIHFDAQANLTILNKHRAFRKSILILRPALAGGIP